ncbi:hypothetical protein LUZ63_005998 [Rhynchospora breviuscula]|uniref:Small VCP/p97-interacting protein n=1 Tax=Rhynchospora breviuscula TaxID=2022672 RepID=A0A9Q0CP70_9POAL|nr:hypothetical protein LUZ63_005998 [Rhynchospora breviuscula]
MGNCSCFGPSKAERIEADRIESQDARAKAAEAAQKRQEQFDKSAVGRAARAQMVAAKKPQVQSSGEPVLKWQMG